MTPLTIDCTHALHANELAFIRRILPHLRNRIGQSARLSCTFVAATRIRTLNRQYRGVNRPTDVLSFGWKHGGAVMGDVLVCPAVIRRQKGWPGTTPQRIAHRMVHGVLHVLGYNHEHRRNARRMERLEREILEFDPYALVD